MKVSFEMLEIEMLFEKYKMLLNCLYLNLNSLVHDQQVIMQLKHTLSKFTSSNV